MYTVEPLIKVYFGNTQKHTLMKGKLYWEVVHIFAYAFSQISWLTKQFLKVKYELRIKLYRRALFLLTWGTTLIKA